MAFEPVHIPAPEEEKGEPEKVTLFFLGDTEYQVPAVPEANVALRYLRDVRTQGEEQAAANLMVSLLGEEGFDALCDYRGLTSKQLEAVMKAAQQHVLGALEATRGNSGRGSRK